jgi:DNA polymerase-3 subunit alpha
MLDSGFLSRVLDVRETCCKKVYDLHVENDHSYLTSNCVVHNSVGGSLVAYLLGIHVADSIKYGLIFERFHNIEKTAFPDIDTDIDPDGRDAVKKYIIDKYGKDMVAHVSNLSRITPKVVVKDIARSLELGGSKSEAFKIANEITNSIPDDAKNLDDALKCSKKFLDYASQYPDLVLYGRKLSGLEKVYSTHAGGIIVSDVSLPTYVPLRLDKNNQVSIQYEKDRCEKVGLVKIDLLGLEHLRIIKNTISNIRNMGEDCLEPDDLPLDDKKVWESISMGNTMCVFQMESGHMRNICKKIKPKSIEDLSVVNALGRPSAINSRDSYIRRRNGKEKVTYVHSCLSKALNDTFGVCVFEEQLAKIANNVAGWDLNKADGLRKLTKLKSKGKALAAQLKSDFVRDAMNCSNLDNKMALKIWEDVIEPFAEYGFNLSHGLLYSINGYHSAYYKYYYPAAFMAAVLKSEVEKTSSNDEKIKTYKKEAARMNINIVAPDINKSDEYFSVSDRSTIVMGLGAIKGVGVKAVENIVETRNEHQFVSFSDFLYRTNSRLVRKDVIQALAKAGCFDSFGISRSCAFHFYDVFRTETSKLMKKQAVTGKDPWDLLTDVDSEMLTKIMKKDEEISQKAEEWDRKDLLSFEKEVLGEYVSGGVEEVYDGFFTKRNVLSLARLSRMADNTPVRVEAVVDSVTQAKTKSGKNKGSAYGSCTLVDINNDSATLKVWSNKWKSVKDRIIAGKPIRALCRVNVWNNTHTLVLDRIEAVME